MEKDDEINGATGTSYTAEFWQYDPRIGRRWNLDPVDQISISNYAAFGLNPIIYIDPRGNKKDWYISNAEGASDEPIWLPNNSNAETHFGEGGFINLGETLGNEAQVFNDGTAEVGRSHSVPSYLINAKGEYGQKDIEHSDQVAENPRIMEYHSTTIDGQTGNPCTSSAQAWCASFTNWNILQAGLAGNETTHSALASSYNKWNMNVVQINRPAIGAIAVINNSHVTFVIGVNGNNIHGYGGNQGNQVKVSTFVNPSSVKYYMPVGVSPNYDVPTININFNSVTNESTR